MELAAKTKKTDNTKLPKLSIIMPVYNGEIYIEKTICKLLGSTYQNIELLIIDDGSTDKSLEICKKYSNLDSRVKVYHKENEGVAAARNYGLTHAAGDYIGFCDQDDEVSNEMYQKMMDRIQQDGSQVAICGSYRKKKNSERIVFEQFKDNLYNKQEIRDKLLLPMLFRGFHIYRNKEICIYPTIWKCIISKQLVDEKQLRFYSFVNHEDDLVMMVQLLLNAEKISTLSENLYYWNTNINSETYQCRRKYLKNLESKQQDLLQFMITELLKHGIPKAMINKLKYVMHCKNVLLLLDNLSLIKNIHFFKKMEIIQNNRSVIYIQSKKDCVRSEKGFVRNTIIIPLVKKKHIIGAYFFNQCINWIRFFVEKYHITELLERKMKG